MNSIPPHVRGCLVGAALIFSTVSAVAQDNQASGGTDLSLINAGAIWRYLDHGEADAAWRSPRFDDSTWATGPAQLGYGDGDEATVVSFGPDTTQKHITTWFRRAVDVVDATQVARLTVRLLRDDGAVVYLNGQEIVRDNMPPGEISSQTLAVSTAGPDENQFHEFVLGPTFLVTGRNVLAVEVHQVNAASSDLSFDLQLTAGLTSGPPLPVVSIAATTPETTEPSPTTRIIPGEFTITRDGDTSEPVLLFVEFGGTAALGQDYEEASQYVSIPPGATSAKIVVAALEDAVVEGDETVIATVSANPPINSLPNYRVDPQRNRAQVVIHDSTPANSPVVSLELLDPVAAETLIFQNNIDWAEFRVLRTGPVTDYLAVYFNTTQGSARFGEDYRFDRMEFGTTVTFRPGEQSVNVRLYPLDDPYYEGDESAFCHLVAPPSTSDPYQIDLAHSSVAMVIHDNDPVATRLDITSPHDGQEFQPGDVIELRAEIIGPGSANSWSVEFFAGDQSLGTTQPGVPIWWGDASGGKYVISARAIDAQGNVLTSTPTRSIQVGPGAALPVVKISANPWRTGEPCPTCFVAPSLLTIERTGPTTAALRVFLDIDGTATPDDDYQALPASVEIPVGQRSAQLTVWARDDQLAEGPEVVRVRLLRQPPPLEPPTYFVNVYATEALVVISDDEAGAPQARLDIIAPTNGAHFGFPSTVELSAMAVDTQSEVYGPVEFFADGQLVATSVESASDRPTIPGLPSVHTASWVNPPIGPHVLTARTRVSLDQFVTAPPINVMVDSPEYPVVRLETSPLQDPQAREFCSPNLECAYPSFVVRRSGSTAADLGVYLSYSGTATAGTDYPALPNQLVIPAGHDSAAVMLVPKDDALIEGPETVIATFTPVPGHGYVQDPNHARATITIIDNERPLDTVVSIGADDEVASEISLLAVIDPARFRVSRSGDLSRDLLVFYSVHGSAIGGVDYVQLTPPVQIPAGQSSATFDVMPKFDQLEEGMETVVIRLEPSPLMNPLPSYEIDPIRRDAVAIILDNGSFRTPGIEIIAPEEGDHFPEQAAIEIAAAAYHPTASIGRVDFFDGGVKIGESVVADPDPATGGLVRHRMLWANPPAGVHSLTAQGFGGAENSLLISRPVRIFVGPDPPPPPILSIAATQPIAEESSFPFRRLALRGEFTVSRTGATAEALSVFVHFSGMATPGTDYPELPWLVTIPAGAASTSFAVVPVNDQIPEPIETVVATLSECPPATNPPMGIPCRGGFQIDPARAEATVFIRDDGVTQASVSLTRPKPGAHFALGDPILLEAVAIDLEGYISHLEFWDGNTRIGESQIDFIRAPDPGTPVQHSFEWRGAAAGPHTLTARFFGADATALMSLPVPITVEPGQSHPPSIAITRPVAGSTFPADTPIEIVTDVRDPDGYVRRVEFFAEDREIGETGLEFIRPPDPGQPQTFTFVWREPPPGLHTLTARAIDNNGASEISAPVDVKVGMSEPMPIVTVTARDPFAVEPQAGADPNTATFRIHRFGLAAEALAVAYSVRGTAQNGVDYKALPGVATIPAGLRHADVVVEPLADTLSEGIETVVVQLESPPAPGAGVVANAYRVGRPQRAAAVISDAPWVASPGAAQCLALPERLLHLCFAAETGENYRLEASADLWNWETLFDAVSSDGAWHFVDTDMSDHPFRFYRLSPEPVAGGE